MLELLAAASPKVLDGFRWPLLTAGIALVVSWIATPLVSKLAVNRGAVDDPTRDDRRVHTTITPRWGGIAIYLGILVALLAVLPLAFPKGPFPAYLIGLLGIGAVITAAGAVDDLVQLSAAKQLLILLGCGIAIQFIYDPAGRVQIQGFGNPLSHAWLPLGPVAAALITAFYLFVVSKTTDTIDGIDGLTAGIAVISSATLAIIAIYAGQPRVALISGAIGGASLGFLRYNYNPARIFMGTGGAQLLGFMLASISIVGALKTAAAFAVVVPMLAFGVPIFDAGFVVTKRLLSGVPITQADKRHLHHTLLTKGLSQRQAVAVLYAIAAALSAVLLCVVIRKHA